MSLEFIESYSWKNLIPGKGKEKLDYITKLTHLFLNGQNITKIGDLSACRYLKVLYLHNNLIEKIENIPQFTELTHLYLQWNKIEKIENLNNLKNLKKLYLGNNRLQCLENLNNLNKLEELYLEYQQFNNFEIFQIDTNCITAISASLKILNICGLKLINLEWLHKLEHLEILYASDNNFIDANELGKTLSHMHKLYKVDFRGCPAQKDRYYREKITLESNALETLDDKIISKYTRAFIKRLDQIKSDKIEKIDNKTRITENNDSKLIFDNMWPLNSSCIDNNKNAILYKSWHVSNVKQTKKSNNKHKTVIDDNDQKLINYKPSMIPSIVFGSMMKNK